MGWKGGAGGRRHEAGRGGGQGDVLRAAGAGASGLLPAASERGSSGAEAAGSDRGGASVRRGRGLGWEGRAGGGFGHGSGRVSAADRRGVAGFEQVRSRSAAARSSRRAGARAQAGAMARTAAGVAAAAGESGRASTAAVPPAAGAPAAAQPAAAALPRSSLAGRHPAHWTTRPLPLQAALSRHSEFFGREWAPSIAYIDMTDIRVPDPGFEWRIDVCVRGNKAKGCPDLVLTALVTAVGEYIPSSERPPPGRETDSEPAADSSPAPSGSRDAGRTATRANWARRAPGWPNRPAKRRCLGP